MARMVYKELFHTTIDHMNFMRAKQHLQPLSIKEVFNNQGFTQITQNLLVHTEGKLILAKTITFDELKTDFDLIYKESLIELSSMGLSEAITFLNNH